MQKGAFKTKVGILERGGCIAFLCSDLQNHQLLLIPIPIPIAVPMLRSVHLKALIKRCRNSRPDLAVLYTIVGGGLAEPAQSPCPVLEKDD